MSIENNIQKINLSLGIPASDLGIADLGWKSSALRRLDACNISEIDLVCHSNIKRRADCQFQCGIWVIASSDPGILSDKFPPFPWEINAQLNNKCKPHFYDTDL